MTLCAFANSTVAAGTAAAACAALAVGLAWFRTRPQGAARRAAGAAAGLAEVAYAIPGVVISIAFILVLLRPLPGLGVGLYGTLRLIGLRERIADRHPAHGVLGEEEGPANPGAALTWAPDPVDGTAAFVAGVPVHGALIAVVRDGAPVLGIVDMHRTGGRWLGVRDRPTLHGGRPCRTRICAALDAASLSVSIPDFFGPEARPALDRLRKATAWRVWGASCLACGLLASARTDLALDDGFGVQDFAGFVPVTEGAPAGASATGR